MKIPKLLQVFRDAEDEFETANSFKGKGNSPKVQPPSCKSIL